VVFGGMNWWSVEDLRAEIRSATLPLLAVIADVYREESSNNRIKSGYSHRGKAPIDRVPDAGSTSVSCLYPAIFHLANGHRAYQTL
jgi:hypothetical protein